MKCALVIRSRLTDKNIIAKLIVMGDGYIDVSKKMNYW